MSEFSLALLAKKFSELDISQESVETISFWMIHHRRHAGAIVKFWSERLIIAPDSRKLALLFVANDILKSNKIKSKVYHKEFERVMPGAMIHIAETCSSKHLLHQTRRMLTIWQAQKYFKKEIVDQLWSCFDGEYDVGCEIVEVLSQSESENETSDLENDIEPMDLKKMFLATEAPEPEELIKALKSLKNLPSSDKVIRTKISNFPIKDVNAFDDREQAENYAKNLEQAAFMIEEYNENLEFEISEREKVDRMLSAFNESELERIAEIEEKLQQVTEELERVSIVRKQIKEHRASFPDLGKFGTIQVLPPLPKVEDLFKKH